jgi:hypothetical protein
VFPWREWCRPSANVERRVKISLSTLFLGELGEAWQLGQTAIRKSPVAGFHQGGAFQPRGWKSAKDRHESVGETDFREDVNAGGVRLRQIFFFPCKHLAVSRENSRGQ